MWRAIASSRADPARLQAQARRGARAATVDAQGSRGRRAPVGTVAHRRARAALRAAQLGRVAGPRQVVARAAARVRLARTRQGRLSARTARPAHRRSRARSRRRDARGTGGCRPPRCPAASVRSCSSSRSSRSRHARSASRSATRCLPGYGWRTRTTTASRSSSARAARCTSTVASRPVAEAVSRSVRSHVGPRSPLDATDEDRVVGQRRRASRRGRGGSSPAARSPPSCVAVGSTSLTEPAARSNGRRSVTGPTTNAPGWPAHAHSTRRGWRVEDREECRDRLAAANPRHRRSRASSRAIRRATASAPRVPSQLQTRRSAPAVASAAATPCACASVTSNASRPSASATADQPAPVVRGALRYSAATVPVAELGVARRRCLQAERVGHFDLARRLALAGRGAGEPDERHRASCGTRRLRDQLALGVEQRLVAIGFDEPDELVAIDERHEQRGGVVGAVRLEGARASRRAASSRDPKRRAAAGCSTNHCATAASSGRCSPVSPTSVPAPRRSTSRARGILIVRSHSAASRSAIGAKLSSVADPRRRRPRATARRGIRNWRRRLTAHATAVKPAHTTLPVTRERERRIDVQQRE